jgi:hypothetical protein
MHPHMRKEFFSHLPSPLARVLGFIFVVVGVIGTGVDLLYNRPLEGRAIETVLLMICVVFTLATLSRWKKRNDAPPLLIAIDDSGLWLREVGEVMHWSEVQSVKISYWGTASCTIRWRHNSIRLESTPELYSDRDGKTWVAPAVYREIRSHWERCAAAVPDAPQAV